MKNAMQFATNQYEVINVLMILTGKMYRDAKLEDPESEKHNGLEALCALLDKNTPGWADD